jgi:hypothetical protein
VVLIRGKRDEAVGDFGGSERRGAFEQIEPVRVEPVDELIVNRANVSVGYFL